MKLWSLSERCNVSTAVTSATEHMAVDFHKLQDHDVCQQQDGIGQREFGNSLRGLLVCDALIIRWGQMRKVLAGEAEDKCHLALFTFS